MRLGDRKSPLRPEWKQNNYKDVVRDTFRFKETLPFPIVHYPNIYGTWILYQQSEESQPLICKCQHSASINYVRLIQQSWYYDVKSKVNLVDFLIPPRVRILNHLKAFSLEEFAELPLFESGLCHLCNLRVPPIRWSNLDEHSIFVQHLGWYLHSALYAVGVSPDGQFLRDILDPELAKIALLEPQNVYRRMRELMKEDGSVQSPDNSIDLFRHNENTARAEIQKIFKTLKQQIKQMHRIIEDRLRLALNFPPVGKTGGAETLLHWILKGLFQGYEVQFHYRGAFLDGLELDIYIPDLHLGIEYQGEQHFRPFEHLGGERHLKQVQRRDKRKAVLCKIAGVDLRYFSIEDKLTEDYVRNSLRDYATRFAKSDVGNKG